MKDRNGRRIVNLDALEHAIERELLRQGFEICDDSERMVRAVPSGDSFYVATEFSRVVRMEKAGRSGLWEGKKGAAQS